MITFMISNPGHHAEIMLPVVRALSARGVACGIVSMAEVNGWKTPAWDVPKGVSVARAIPAQLRKNPSLGASLDNTNAGRLTRRIAHQLVWHTWLAPRLRLLLRDTDAVMVPNDVAYPYRDVIPMLRKRGVPVVLMQEGIRFPLPNEQRQAAVYGRGGSSALCCWGEAAAEHFAAIGARDEALRVTGNPRYDTIDPASWHARGARLLERLALTTKPLLFLSNPIDDQGFCTTAEKMALFEGFLHGAAPLGVPILVKLHMREDPEAFRRSVQRANVNVAVHVVTDDSLFSVLAAGRAAVVLASTVGFEALMFGLPLGVLAIPKHGHVFEYVERGAATPLELGPKLGTSVEILLAGGDRGSASRLLDRHLAHRGVAAERVADAIQSVRR